MERRLSLRGFGSGHVSRACLILDGHVAWSWEGQKLTITPWNWDTSVSSQPMDEFRRIKELHEATIHIILYMIQFHQFQSHINVQLSNFKHYSFLCLTDSHIILNIDGVMCVIRQEIRTSTSSMTSVPKPLKFLRPHYGTLKSYFESMAESDLKVRAVCYSTWYDMVILISNCLFLIAEILGGYTISVGLDYVCWRGKGMSIYFYCYDCYLLALKQVN